MLFLAIQVGFAISVAFAIAFLVYRMMQLYALFQEGRGRDNVMSARTGTANAAE